MIENDTIRLLRECDAGVKMGVSSIDDVFGKIKDNSFRNILNDCKDEHQRLSKDIDTLLSRYHDEGKEPNIMAQGMSKIKTEFKMAVESSDSTIADLLTDGCNMGVKSLSRYLNQYAAADEKSKDITKKLIKIEENLSVDMRSFL